MMDASTSTVTDEEFSVFLSHSVNRCSQDCELLRLRKEESSNMAWGLGLEVSSQI